MFRGIHILRGSGVKRTPPASAVNLERANPHPSAEHRNVDGRETGSGLGSLFRPCPRGHGRAWFEELAIGHARSLQELAKCDGISRRYIRRLVGLAFLSPQLVEAILEGQQSVELTATRLTELDLPLDWTEQHKLVAS